MKDFRGVVRERKRVFHRLASTDDIEVKARLRDGHRRR